MGLKIIPSRTDNSVGRQKQDARPARDRTRELSASEYNRLADALIEVAQAVGLDDGSTPGSIEARLATLGGTSEEPLPGGVFSLPHDRDGFWNPGLNAIGGIPSDDDATRPATIWLPDGDPFNGFSVDPALAVEDVRLEEAENAGPAIQAALTAAAAQATASSRRVVLLPPGEFLIDGDGLKISSYVTLRGGGARGPLATRLVKGSTRSEIDDGVVAVGRPWIQWTQHVDFAADVAHGDRTITLASNPGYEVGEIVFISQLVDPGVVGSTWNPITQQEPGPRSWYGRFDRPTGQLLEIESIDGNTLTFTTPIRLPYLLTNEAQLSRLAGSAREGFAHDGPPQPANKWAGIEDLYVRSGREGNITLSAAAYCWVKGVESEDSDGSSITLAYAFRCEVRDSFFHSTHYPTPGGAGYGIDVIVYSADNLIENNISWNFNKVMAFRAAGPGNVVGYNFAQDGWGRGYPTAPEVGINASHYASPHHELFEGNETWNLGGDSNWGNSMFLTFFRNNVTARRLSIPPLAISEEAHREFAVVPEWHYNYSFIGNILGHYGMASAPQGRFVHDLAPPWNRDGVVPIWTIGRQADSGLNGIDERVAATTLRHGNYEGLYGVPFWSEPERNLPPSLYLEEKPSFFGDLPWPWTNVQTGHVGRLPAKERFMELVAQGGGDPRYARIDLSAEEEDPPATDSGLFVQGASSRAVGGTEHSVSFSEPVTPGNLLIASILAGGWELTGVPDPEGWTRLRDPIDVRLETNRPTYIWWKVSDGTETGVSVISPVNAQSIMMLAEYDVPNAVLVETRGRYQQGEEPTSGGTSLAAREGDLAIGIAMGNDATNPAEHHTWRNRVYWTPRVLPPATEFGIRQDESEFSFLAGLQDMPGGGLPVEASVRIRPSGWEAVVDIAIFRPGDAPDPGATFELPEERDGFWQPGLMAVGGIPGDSDATRPASIWLPGGDPFDGYSIDPELAGESASTAIQAALTAAGGEATESSRRIVLIPPGNYFLDASLNLPSYVTLRGMGARGASATRLLQRLADHSGVNVGQLWIKNGHPIDVAEDVAHGDTSVTLASNPGYVVGEIVFIDQLEDEEDVGSWFNTVMQSDPDGPERAWFSRQNRPTGQVLEITEIDGNTLTFSTPIRLDYLVSNEAQISRFTGDDAGGPRVPTTRWAGIEDLYLANGEGGDGGGNIHFFAAAYSWVRGVESANAVGTNIALESAFRCEIRDSFFHTAADPNPGGGGYGIGALVYAADNLFENNIVWSFNKVIVMRASGGGNVIGYNYFEDGWGAGYPTIPEVGISAAHYATPHHELLEGNRGWNISGDALWGNSIFLTFYRNHITGRRRATPPLEISDETMRRLVVVPEKQLWTTLAGNVLGSASMIAAPQSGFTYENELPWSYDPVPMYSIGVEHDAGEEGQDARVVETLIRHGDFDWHRQVQGWDPEIPDQRILPASLYLPSSPAFFEEMAWPWVVPSTGAVHTLPAVSRFNGYIAASGNGTPYDPLAPSFPGEGGDGDPIDTLVQGAPATGNSATPSATLASPATAGNTLLFAVGSFTGDAVSPYVDPPEGWTLVTEALGNDAQWGALFMRTAEGGETTVEVSLSRSVAFSAYIWEDSGLDSVVAVQGGGSNDVDISTSTVTTVSGGSILGIHWRGAEPFLWTPGPGWTEVTQPAGTKAMYAQTMASDGSSIRSEVTLDGGGWAAWIVASFQRK